MNKSESIKELATALSKFQGKMLTAHKGSDNPFFKSKYADLAEVVKTATPGLAECGLSVSQLVGANEQGTTLTTILMHSSGDFISSEMPLLISKQDAQGQGSALTYARRYSYMSIIGMVADEDDDGHKASLQTMPPISRPIVTPPKKVAPLDTELSKIAIRGRVMMGEKKLIGAEATAFSQMIIDKDKPESIEDWQALITAMED